MAENTLSFLWLVAALLVPVVLGVRAFLGGGWLVARLEGRGPCPRVEPREGCRCNHCRGRCLCASRAAAQLAARAARDREVGSARKPRAHASAPELIFTSTHEMSGT
jgi:hypothetical protein